jgi:hypothetical protein
MALSRSCREASPDVGAIPFRLQLVELSQLAQGSSGFLAQPACAHERRRYAEPSGFGAALRTPVVLGHWLVNKRGPVAVQRGRRPLKSRPFVLSTNSGFGRRQTTFDANGAVARALFDWLVNLGQRVFDEESAM